MRRLTYNAAAFLVAAGLFSGGQAAADGFEFFEREVRPVLVEHCHGCHGPEKQKSGLRLDHGDYVMQGGETGQVVESGNPEASRLVEAVRYGNVDLQMPPSGKLPDAAIAALERWVAEGARWPDEPIPEHKPAEEEFDLAARKAAHWAWQPVTQPVVPEVGADDWVSSPVDAFILARLEEKNLRPAARAQKHQLLRRAYFDLIGLPPTPEEVDAFLRDDSPEAFEKVVDQLLASPHFGERWGRHWLDLVRYAETYGHEQDYPIRHAWQYRDYVIRALNADVPYDRFVMEHIAGDLLPEPRHNPELGVDESIIATGFWYMHQATHAPVDVRQDEADRVDNQVDVLTKAFLGMTVSCARCHEHKFDAISTEDYYALTGFMQSSRQQYAYLDPHGAIAEARARLEELHADGSAALEKEIEAWLTDQEGIAPYLVAAHEVYNGAWKDGDGREYLLPNIVFDDFESGSLANWTAHGADIAAALSARERTNTKEVQGFGGNWFMNSLNSAAADGLLRSVPFVIERQFLHFKIAGTKNMEKAGFRLRVDDEIVLQAAGDNSRGLAPQVWDLDPWMGKTGVLEVYDSGTGDAAFVLLDDIVFSAREKAWQQRRPVARVAEEQGVDPFRLMRWAAALEGGGLENPAHPLHSFWKLTRYRRDADLPGLEWHVKEHAAQRALPEGDVVYEDFNGPLEGWFNSGAAFAEVPAGGPWAPLDEQVRFVSGGVADSGMIAPKLHGTLRSPDFTITHERIHVRAAGVRSRIRLVVEGYELREFNGLLFGDTLIDVNTGGAFQWYTMHRDTRKFVGATAYIEFIDDGDGYIAVDEIRFSEHDAPRESADPLAPQLARHAAPGDNSVAGLASAYDALLKETLAAWRGGDADPAAVRLVNWLLDYRLAKVSRGWRDVQKIVREMGGINAAIPDPMRVLAIMDGTPRENYVHIRGGYKNAGAPVPRRFLEAVAGREQPPVGEGSGRLALAQRLLAPENPLPARVIANRVWHYLTGRGIVGSVDNFGVLGERPTHPELLDHLANVFVEQGWSLKKFIKYVMLSNVYQMDSAPVDAVAEEADPDNTLLHRARLRRLEGEVIRDSILAVAGTLNKDMFGYPVDTYLSDFMKDNRAPGHSGPMDGDRRRTIYLEVRRNYMAPILTAFDMPLPDTTIGRRTVSNVPSQSLILLNDPFVQQQAEAWGARIAAAGDDVNARLEALYRTALGRVPNAREREKLRAFIEQQLQLYGLDMDTGTRDPRVWADVCHVMFTLKEFIFVG